MIAAYACRRFGRSHRLGQSRRAISPARHSHRHFGLYRQQGRASCSIFATRCLREMAVDGRLRMPRMISRYFAPKSAYADGLGRLIYYADYRGTRHARSAADAHIWIYELSFISGWGRAPYTPCSYTGTNSRGAACILASTGRAISASGAQPAFTISSPPLPPYSRYFTAIFDDIFAILPRSSCYEGAGALHES